MAQIVRFPGDRQSTGPILGSEARRAATDVPQAEVDRLLAGVRDAVTIETGRGAAHSPSRLSRLMSVAAAAAAITVALVGVSNGLRDGAGLSGAEATSFVMLKQADGTVAVEFGDLARSHSVTASQSPQMTDGVAERVSAGERFVESAERSIPGTITYYRID